MKLYTKEKYLFKAGVNSGLNNLAETLFKGKTGKVYREEVDEKRRKENKRNISRGGGSLLHHI